MTWLDWLDFISEHWPQLLGAVLIMAGWLMLVAVVYYNKGARDHGCEAKIAERSER